MEDARLSCLRGRQRKSFGGKEETWVEQTKYEGGKSVGDISALQIEEPDAAAAAARTPRPRWLSLLLLGLGIIILLSVVGALIASFHNEILDAIYWCQRKRPWSALIYGLIVIVATLLGIPTMPFEIAAGFIFGLGVSFLILTVAKPIGVVGCLLLGRYFLHSYASKLTAESEEFRGLLVALEWRPWRLLLLLRMALMPGVVKNYGVALLPSLPILTVFLCAFLGDMPYSLLWSFVGSRGASLVGMLEGEMARTPVETALSLLGIIVLVLLVAGVRHTVQGAVEASKREAEESKDEFQYDERV